METKKKQELILWSKIAELRSKNLTAPQVAQVLRISRHTARRLYNLSEEELLQRQRRRSGRTRLLTAYENFIVSLLEFYPYYTSIQIQERLKVEFSDMPSVCEKTVFNFIKHIRKKYDIPARK